MLGLAVLEGLALAAYHGATGRGVPGRRLAPNLAAGCALLLTLRLAIGGAWWGWLGLGLAGAGVAHGVDLWVRWRGVGGSVSV